MENKIENILNYLWLDENIATGGQPTEQQLELIKNAGYQIIINLALPTSDNALVDEKKVVESLGMKYINIPIDFNRPTVEEFALFAKTMQSDREQKTFVHCAANLRVSAFMYLYRIIYLDISPEAAKQDLYKLWHPNQTWQDLIDRVASDRS